MPTAWPVLRYLTNMPILIRIITQGIWTTHGHGTGVHNGGYACRSTLLQLLADPCGAHIIMLLQGAETN